MYKRTAIAAALLLTAFTAAAAPDNTATASPGTPTSASDNCAAGDAAQRGADEAIRQAEEEAEKFGEDLIAASDLLEKCIGSFSLAGLSLDLFTDLGLSNIIERLKKEICAIASDHLGDAADFLNDQIDNTIWEIIGGAQGAIGNIPGANQILPTPRIQRPSIGYTSPGSSSSGSSSNTSSNTNLPPNWPSDDAVLVSTNWDGKTTTLTYSDGTTLIPDPGAQLVWQRYDPVTNTTTMRYSDGTKGSVSFTHPDLLDYTEYGATVYRDGRIASAVRKDSSLISAYKKNINANEKSASSSDASSSNTSSSDTASSWWSNIWK